MSGTRSRSLGEATFVKKGQLFRDWHVLETWQKGERKKEEEN